MTVILLLKKSGILLSCITVFFNREYSLTILLSNMQKKSQKNKMKKKKKNYDKIANCGPY